MDLDKIKARYYLTPVIELNNVDLNIIRALIKEVESLQMKEVSEKPEWVMTAFISVVMAGVGVAAVLLWRACA